MATAGSGTGNSRTRKRRAGSPALHDTRIAEIGCLMDEFIIVLQDVAMLKKLREVMATPGDLSIAQQSFNQQVRVYVNETWDDSFVEYAFKKFKEFAGKGEAYKHLPFPKARDTNKCINDKQKDRIQEQTFAQEAHQRDDILGQLTVLFTMMSPQPDAPVKRLKTEDGIKQEDAVIEQEKATSSTVQIKKEEGEDSEEASASAAVHASLSQHVEKAMNTVFRTSVSKANIDTVKKTCTANSTHFNALADTEKRLHLIVLLRVSIALASNAVLTRSRNESQTSTYHASFNMFFPPTFIERETVIPLAIERITEHGGIAGLDSAFLEAVEAAATVEREWSVLKESGDRLLDFLVKTLAAVPNLQHPCEAVVEHET